MRSHDRFGVSRTFSLNRAHRKLDAAVAAAYGWPTDLSDDEVLARLFALNQADWQGEALRVLPVQ